MDTKESELLTIFSRLSESGKDILLANGRVALITQAAVLAEFAGSGMQNRQSPELVRQKTRQNEEAQV
jgi:hypothetical protein